MSSLTARIALCALEATGIAVSLVVFIGYWVATP